MGSKIRVWLADDRSTIHHAESALVEGMHVPDVSGPTDCGVTGLLTLVHHELVDMGKLCEGCLAVSGPSPRLAGDSYGPV